MPQSLAQIWLHIVFSTKDRRPHLQDATFRSEMFRMLAYHTEEQGCVSVSVSGHVDHVHLLVGLSRTITVARLVEQIKIKTSQWAKSSHERVSLFAWQAGYGAFSVSHSNRTEVDKYIRQQEMHHNELSFQDEFRKLCDRHEVKIDERYVWE